jgi:putative heme-binding domain-containing protein
MKRTLPLAVLLFCAAALPLAAQKDAKVPDPDPELERKSFEVADGFEVNLFAADPLLLKPIQMNFDAAGRLWVACSEAYPQIKPGQEANDKIIVLEDTKGVGKADKTTVFADGLLIPTGLEPGDGGVYVANSTDMLHLADTDGDGKADKRRVVLSGFGTEDTHHLIHTFRWGPDGMMYFNQSVYIHSHVETPHGPRHLNAGGIWQFRPETLELEVFARGWWNAWGHAWDYWGNSLLTDGAGSEGINYVIPGGYYPAAVGTKQEFHGLNPGSPKYCGLEILSGRHLPDDWQGNLITNDFRGHRVCRFVVKEDGAGFSAQEKPELIKTKHEAFRPIDVKMGPDGAIYVADWYNPIIQHGEVDFRDPRRDQTHGRIWRVTAKGRDLVKRPQLVDAPVEKLLDELKAPEQWTRHFAKRVLKERFAKAVEPALAKWVAGLDAKDPDHEHHLVEALWTYQSLDVVEPKLLTAVLHAHDGHARAAGVRVVQQWHERLANPLELLAPRVNDDDPRVRLEAVRALGSVPQPRSVELATEALDRPGDKFTDYALFLTVRELEPVWLPLLQQGQLNFGGNTRHLLFALQAIDSAQAVKPLMTLIQGGKVAKDQEESVLTLLAALGGPPELGLVLDRALAKEGNTAGKQAALLGALEQAGRQRKVRPAGDLARVGGLLGSDSDGVRAGAARLAGLWQVEGLRPPLAQLAEAAGTSDAVRPAALDGLTLLGGAESKKTLDRLTDAGRPLRQRAQAVAALAALDLDTAAARASDVLSADQQGADSEVVFDAFVQRKNGPAVLAKALGDKKLSADVAKVGVRVLRASGQAAPALQTALEKAGALSPAPRAMTADELKQMVAEVKEKGDPARGEALYRRKDMLCQKCHAIGGAGGQVGPDLVSIGASAPVDYLIESLLLPNKVVKEGFHSLRVTLNDGKVVTGIKVRETKAELVLRTAEDREVTVATDNIDEKANGPSLMPDGLADPLTHSELVDLVRFLSELGKVGPYSLSKARLARRWQVLEPTEEAKKVLQGGLAAAGNDPQLIWSSAYATVAGVLPLENVPRLDVKAVPTGLVRCQLDVSSAGKVKLLLSSARGLTCWLDGAPVEAKEEMTPDLAVGVHTLTFAVDLAQRTDGLRLELDDVPGSKGQARIVGAK